MINPSGEVERGRKVCIVCENWESGGIEGFLSNLLLHMDRGSLRVDIVAARLRKSVFTQPLKEAGIRFIELSGHLYQLRTNYDMFRQLIQKERYDVVHLNAFQGMSLNYLKLAAEAGVPVRIAHSHNTALRKSRTRGIKLLIHAACRKLLAKYATEYWACSMKAAQFLFPSRKINSQYFQIIPNGIDISRFRRSHLDRLQARSALGIKEGNLVIGHIGRLCEQKNQSFLIDIFANIKKQNADSVLLLVGDGDSAALEIKARRLGLQESVILYGTSDKVECLLWAMDIFVFPSLFEGFGIVVLEAQAAGLPVVCSDHVPEEARFLPTTHMLPLEDGAEKWAEQILRVCKEIPDQSENIKKAGFEINEVVIRVKNRYFQ